MNVSDRTFDSTGVVKNWTFDSPWRVGNWGDSYKRWGNSYKNSKFVWFVDRFFFWSKKRKQILSLAVKKLCELYWDT